MKVSLFKLYYTFAYIGLVTFGGGLAMLPIFNRVLIEKNNWCTEEDLARYYAIGQCTPGIIAVNTSTFIGYKERDVIGGIVATLGMVTPSYIIITLIATVLTNFEDNIYVINAMAGIRIGVCVLMTNAILKLAKNAIVDIYTTVVFLIALFLLFILGISPVVIVLFGILAGLIYTLVKAKKEVRDAQ